MRITILTDSVTPSSHSFVYISPTRIKTIAVMLTAAKIETTMLQVEIINTSKAKPIDIAIPTIAES